VGDSETSVCVQYAGKYVCCVSIGGDNKVMPLVCRLAGLLHPKVVVIDHLEIVAGWKNARVADCKGRG
jgi:hypothetical protein